MKSFGTWLLIGFMMEVGVIALPAQNPVPEQVNKGFSQPDASSQKTTLVAKAYMGVIEKEPRDGWLTLKDLAPPKPENLNLGNSLRLNKAQMANLQRMRFMAQALKDTPRLEREFFLGEKTPIRFKILAQPYDDKGNIVQPTKEVIRKLKGPGIEGKWDQIRPGHLVRVEQINKNGSIQVKMVTVLGETPLPIDDFSGSIKRFP